MCPLNPVEQEIEADMMGFSFPVYSFGMPHIVREFFKSMKASGSPKKVFILITSGDISGSGSTAKKAHRLLAKKNCDLIYSEVLKMPHNWITYSHASPEEMNKVLIAGAVEMVNEIVRKILGNVRSFYDVRRTPLMLRVLGNTVNFLFRVGGRKKLMQWFRVYDSCDGCGMCADACPTKCIEMKNGIPVWAGNCEQCMRCVNVCPQEAIYQKMGETKGKKRYFAPGFDPLKQ
jgi:ferredoxin